MPKVIIGFATKQKNLLWEFVRFYLTHSGETNRYWFHYFTKMEFARIQEQVWMICETSQEDDFYNIYSDRYMNHQVKRFCLWRNPKISQEFRLYMMEKGFQPELGDFKHVLNTKQTKVIKEIVKQTISDEFLVVFWEAAIEDDAKDILSVFIDYILREGLTPRSCSYVMQSYDCIAKKAVSKALDTHKAIAFIKRSKPNDVFRQLLIKGVHIPYEAQCFLTLDLYKIYKECSYTLGEKAVIYHLKKEGEMAKEILKEGRDFTSDIIDIIAKSTKLSSWWCQRT
jgi:hypothetical protein